MNNQSSTQQLLNKNPFDLDSFVKKELFDEAIFNAFNYHYNKYPLHHLAV